MAAPKKKYQSGPRLVEHSTGRPLAEDAPRVGKTSPPPPPLVRAGIRVGSPPSLRFSHTSPVLGRWVRFQRTQRLFRPELDEVGGLVPLHELGESVVEPELRLPAQALKLGVIQTVS